MVSATLGHSQFNIIFVFINHNHYNGEYCAGEQVRPHKLMDMKNWETYIIYLFFIKSIPSDFDKKNIIFMTTIHYDNLCLINLILRSAIVE